MTQQPTYGPHNLHPLSQMKTELMWEGKYDECGNRREVDVAGCAMPMQKIESIDEPRRAAAAEGQLGLFEQQNLHQDDFRSRLIWGDNKLVMASLLQEFRGKVDLIYIDPPFDVGADFTMSVPYGEKDSVLKDQSVLEMVAYRDMWGKGKDSYFSMLYERLTLIREILSDSGSVYVHVDWHVSHYVKALLDEVFGAGNFQNEIIWQRTSARNDSKTYNHIHDTIFFFSKGKEFTWNPQLEEHSDEYLMEKYNQIDEDGRRYHLDNMTSPNPCPNMMYEWMGFSHPEKGWRYSKDTMQRLHEEGRIYYPDKQTKRPRLKRYLDEVQELGKPLQSVWIDIFPVNSQANERLDYPTQKSEALLERIIKASSNEGDLVADFFCGSHQPAFAADSWAQGRRVLPCRWHRLIFYPR